MNEYLENGDLSEDKIKAKVCVCAPGNCEIQPMLCGTAFKNKGVQRMLMPSSNCCRRRLIFPPVPV